MSIFYDSTGAVNRSTRYSDRPEVLFIMGFFLILWGLFWFFKGTMYGFSSFRWKVIRMEGHDAHMFALLAMTIGFVMMMLSLVLYAARM